MLTTCVTASAIEVLVDLVTMVQGDQPIKGQAVPPMQVQAAPVTQGLAGLDTMVRVVPPIRVQEVLATVGQAARATPDQVVGGPTCPSVCR